MFQENNTTTKHSEVTMSNNKQLGGIDFLLSHIWTSDWVNYTRDEKLEVIEQAKAMEATSKQMSYGDGYSNGYDRALELVKWKINNELSINNEVTMKFVT